MFAPVGYTPLSMLWDQFVDAKIDAVYRSSAEYYASDEFDPRLVRGSALDIAEHVFLGLMWKCWPHAVSGDGRILRINTRFQDGVPGLFTQVPPFRSAYDAAMTEIECGTRNEIERIASPTFTEWDYDEDEKEMWRRTYPCLAEGEGRMPDELVDQLQFHTLPVCFERNRFTIVRALPHWAKPILHNEEQQVLVEHLGGMAICIPETALVGWDEILSGAIPVLDGEFSLIEREPPKMGRPAKIPRVIDAYQRIYPNGHSCSWKEVANVIGSEIGERVSVQTMRRAIAGIESLGDDAQG